MPGSIPAGHGAAPVPTPAVLPVDQSRRAWWARGLIIIACPAGKRYSWFLVLVLMRALVVGCGGRIASILTHRNNSVNSKFCDTHGYHCANSSRSVLYRSSLLRNTP